MFVQGACLDDVKNLINDYARAVVRKSEYANAAEDALGAVQQSMVPRIQLLVHGTMSLTASIALTIFSFIAKLANRKNDEYRRWHQEERNNIQDAYSLLGHFGMMMISPDHAIVNLSAWYERAKKNSEERLQSR
jgi:hypothetical protein